MSSRPITRKEFEALKEETKKDKNPFIARRDLLMYQIMYYHGFRPGECRLIKLSDINFREKTLFIPAQNNKERQQALIHILDFIFEKIKDYLDKRDFKSKWLFPSYLNKIRKRDKVVDPRTVQLNFNKRMKKLNLLHVSYYDKGGFARYDLNIYSFRKRFGTFAYLKFDYDVERADEVMRHEDQTHRSLWPYVKFAKEVMGKHLVLSLYNDSLRTQMKAEAIRVYS